MISIDLHSRIPVYEQIEEQIIWLINSGVYSSDDRLPSIRSFASELKLNVNTVKRAIQELEAKGIVYSVQGRGVFISPKHKANESLRQEALDDLRISLRSAMAKGLSKSDICEVVDETFSEAGEIK